MVVDESGNEVDPRTGERVKKQEDFEPTPAPVAEAPAPAPATEKLEATNNDDDDDDDGFMTAEQLKEAASKSGLDAVIKNGNPSRNSQAPARQGSPTRAPTQTHQDGGWTGWRQNPGRDRREAEAKGASRPAAPVGRW